MCVRYVTTRSVLGLASVAALIAGLAGVFGMRASAQAPAGAKDQKPAEAKPAYRIPRTADGHPDLQGTWSFANMTPMERPREFGNRATITRQEAEEFEKRMKRQGNERIDTELAYDARVWRDNGKMSNRTSLIVDPPDGRIPALTADGQRRADERAKRGGGTFSERADGPEDRTLGERCILGRPSGPPMRPETYNNTVQIFQSRNQVALLNEMIHTARMVPLNGRPRTGIRQWAGESLGRWEGDVLVIETTNFRADAAAFIARGASENLRLVEKISRVDADNLSYEFTIDDLKTWVKPWTAQFALTKEVGMYEIACHEGNYGMFNILSAARAADKASGGAAKK
jgi:hypothetical protein